MQLKVAAKLPAAGESLVTVHVPSGGAIVHVPTIEAQWVIGEGLCAADTIVKNAGLHACNPAPFTATGVTVYAPTATRAARLNVAEKFPDAPFAGVGQA